MTHAETSHFWTRINWNQQDSHIARLVGASASVVGYWRRRLQKPPANHATTHAFWAQINWSFSDREIAAVLNRTDGGVKHMRRRLAKSGPAISRSRRILKSDDYRSWDWSQPNSALARAHGFSREYIRLLRVRFNIPKINGHVRPL